MIQNETILFFNNISFFMIPAISLLIDGGRLYCLFRFLYFFLHIFFKYHYNYSDNEWNTKLSEFYKPLDKQEMVEFKERKLLFYF